MSFQLNPKRASAVLVSSEFCCRQHKITRGLSNGDGDVGERARFRPTERNGDVAKTSTSIWYGMTVDNESSRPDRRVSDDVVSKFYSEALESNGLTVLPAREW